MTLTYARSPGDSSSGRVLLVQCPDLGPTLAVFRPNFSSVGEGVTALTSRWWQAPCFQSLFLSRYRLISSTKYGGSEFGSSCTCNRMEVFLAAEPCVLLILSSATIASITRLRRRRARSGFRIGE